MAAKAEQKVKKTKKPAAEKTAAMPKKEKSKKTGRFLGWQLTPVHQATFGATTKGGRANQKFEILHSTGEMKNISGSWYLIDATEAPVGRIATIAATILMGKHRATFTPGQGSADGVIIINADKAFFSSDKSEKKMYYWHTRYMGGLRSETAKKALSRRSDEVLWMAVQGMMPKNKLSRYELPRLKIYKGNEHPQQAQKPVTLKITESPLKKILASIAA